jgi:hypothetical protein
MLTEALYVIDFSSSRLEQTLISSLEAGPHTVAPQMNSAVHYRRVLVWACHKTFECSQIHVNDGISADPMNFGTASWKHVASSPEIVSVGVDDLEE